MDQLPQRGYSKASSSSKVANVARDYNMYFNRRSEVWGLMRDCFHNGTVDVPDDPGLEVDLTGPEYGFSNKHHIQLERKEEMKRRGLASPDLGNCLAMTSAVHVAARTQRQSQLVYTFLPENSWME